MLKKMLCARLASFLLKGASLTPSTGAAVLFAVLAVINLSKSNNRPKTIIFP